MRLPYFRRREISYGLPLYKYTHLSFRIFSLIRESSSKHIEKPASCCDK